MTTVRRPARAARKAVAQPTTPAPTTTMSAVAGGRSVARRRKGIGWAGIAPYHRAMPPRPRPRSATPRFRLRSRSRRPLIVGLALLIALAVAGCGSSFDPTLPCTADGSAAGAYPDLEAAIPATYKGAKPSELDSGRACTPGGLGTLVGHGVNELR